MQTYSILHITRYEYSAPVRESVMEVRLKPRSDRQQRCLSFHLDTDPQARALETSDYLRNAIHYFDIPGSHQQLLIRAESLVLVFEPDPLPPQLDEDEWQALDQATATGRFWDWLAPSRYAQTTSQLEQFAQEISLHRMEDPLTTLRTLNRQIHQSFLYTPASTAVDSPIDVALEKRQGVCQDFSHILIALLRKLRIPARYVSGYLYQPEQDLETFAFGASHAWVEAYTPSLGWIGLDPTNDSLATEQHIRVALGRDYADVPPTKGVFKGEATSELSVAVRVRQADRAAQELSLLNEEELLGPIVILGSGPGSQAGRAEQPQQ